MSSLGNVSDTLGILNAVGGILKNAKVDKVIGGIQKGAQVAKHLQETGSAITHFSAQTTILSRVFIDDAVVGEAILPNLIKSFHQWYAAQILAALNISKLVTGDSRTVQQFMTPLQTGQNARQRSVVGNVLTRMSGMESFLQNYLGEGNFEENSALEAFNYHNPMGPKDPNSLRRDTKNKKEALANLKANDELAEYIDKDKTAKSLYPDKPDIYEVKSLNVSENMIGPIGELFEVTLSSQTGRDSSGKVVVAETKVPIYVQMQPSIIPNAVAPRFIDMNVNPSIWKRWTMKKAGEISFLNDFIMKKDLQRRRRALFKDPETSSAFNEFLTTIVKKDEYALGDVTDSMAAQKSSNLANSVIIFTDDTVRRAAAESDIDLYNEKDRQQYFRNAYAMIIAVVDTIHQRVRVWFNGIDGSLDLSYQDFKPNNKNFEPNDFMAALQAFSTNQIGRLR